MAKVETIGNTKGPLCPMKFLELAGEEDVIRFLRRLPMIGGTPNGKISLSDLIYEMQLWPFVKTAWSKVDGSPGIPGRLLQVAAVYKAAEAEMEAITGKKRRVERVIDLPSFIDINSTVGLP